MTVGKDEDTHSASTSPGGNWLHFPEETQTQGSLPVQPVRHQLASSVTITVSHIIHWISWTCFGQVVLQTRTAPQDINKGLISAAFTLKYLYRKSR